MEVKIPLGNAVKSVGQPVLLMYSNDNDDHDNTVNNGPVIVVDDAQRAWIENYDGDRAVLNLETMRDLFQVAIDVRDAISSV